MKWTFQITYDATDDNGVRVRPRSALVVEADSISAAIVAARAAASSIKGARIGAFLPGEHVAVP